jgi:uncharacterized membrane protein
MLPNPLHPAVVHFPIVLMFLVPIAAVGALWAIRRGAKPLKAWSIAVAFAGALAVSAWVAVETGEGQGERVERVVAEAPLESHEERAETFLALAGILAGISLIGFVRGVVGTSARLATAAGAVALVFVGARVGRSGGELVYRYGAASAYANDTTRAGELLIGERDRRRGGDHDER